MKRTLMIIAGVIATFAFSASGYAQQAKLVEDQNPRYESSRAKYMNMSDSLTTTQGTTVQNTYKAYDWYEAREERRKLRRERNFQLGLYSYPYYQNYSAYPGFGFGIGYSHSHRNWGHNSWYGNNWYGW
jgi:hypothetical protein